MEKGESRGWDFIRKWILPLIWLSIVTFGTYFLIRGGVR